jgi:AraC-like DNA-binding protein
MMDAVSSLACIILSRKIIHMANQAPGRRVFTYPETLVPALRSIGWTHTRRAGRNDLSEHHHDGFWEVCWLRRGRLDWWAGSERHRIQAGQIFLARPHEVHGACYGALEPCELYWIQLADPAPRQAPMVAALLPALRCAPRLLRGSEALNGPWRRIIDELTTPDRWTRLSIGASLATLCVTLGRCLDAPDLSPALSPHIARAITWLGAQRSWLHPVAILAREAGLSPTTLHARFCAELGIGPSAWMQQRRLDEAQRLLSETDLAVTEIAMQMGFSSSQHFATRFRRLTGTTPQRWRTGSWASAARTRLRDG